jgi:hypothetical protein
LISELFGFWVRLGRTFVMPRIGMMASLMIGTVSGSAARLALAIGAMQLPGIDLKRTSPIAL